MTIAIVILAVAVAGVVAMIVRARSKAARRLEADKALLASLDSTFRKMLGGDVPLPSQATAAALLKDRTATYGISADKTLIRLGVLQFLTWLLPQLGRAHYYGKIVLLTATPALSELYRQERYGPRSAAASQILTACGIEIAPTQQLKDLFNEHGRTHNTEYMLEMGRRGAVPLIIVDVATSSRLWFGSGAIVIIIDDGASLRVTEDPRQADIATAQCPRGWRPSIRAAGLTR